jgi:hypothetical protein
MQLKDAEYVVPQIFAEVPVMGAMESGYHVTD